jgi:hypothetical protein
MPYIKDEERRIYSPNAYGMPTAITVGQLNYQITEVCNLYRWSKDKASYQTINDILGALEGAKLEFYRRLAAPYEDQKIKQNGDVY